MLMSLVEKVPLAEGQPMARVAKEQDHTPQPTPAPSSSSALATESHVLGFQWALTTRNKSQPLHAAARGLSCVKLAAPSTGQLPGKVLRAQLKPRMVSPWSTLPVTQKHLICAETVTRFCWQKMQRNLERPQMNSPVQNPWY